MTLILPALFPRHGLASLEDAALVTLARGGRDDAFDELVRRHAPRLHAVASRLVGREEAHDVVQEAFVSALRALPGFREEARFATWLHRIALNACYAQLRRRAPEAGDSCAAELVDRRPGPAEMAERGDLRAALDRALEGLPAEFRETFVLVEFGDLDQADAARVLGVAVGTVKSRLFRARAALRERLEGWGYRP